MSTFLVILAWLAIVACFFLPIFTFVCYVMDWFEHRRYLRNLRRDDPF